MKRLSVLLFFILILEGRSFAATFQEDYDSQFKKNPPGLSLTISTEKDIYRIGEAIPVTLTFTNKSETNYMVSVQNYDRSGRIQDVAFVVDGLPTGFVDPLDIYFAGGFFGGGLGSDRKLGEYAQVFNLNEWIRFDIPGEYRFFCTADMVSEQTGHKSIPLCSQILKVSIKNDRQFLDKTLSKAREDLKSPDSKIQQQAMQTLRFIATPEAAEVLVPFVGNENNNLSIEASLGVIGCRNRAAARKALEKHMEDPAIAVNRQYIYTLALLSIPREELLIKWDPSNEELSRKKFQAVSEKLKDARKKNLGKLAGFLSKKEGRALAVGASLLAEEGVDTPEVRQELAKSFLNLTESEQKGLLEGRWEKIRCAEFVPILEELLKRPPQHEHWYFPGIRSLALLRYSDYRPGKARTIILEDIKRLNPLLSINVLVSLPEPTLPEIGEVLLTNLKTGSTEKEKLGALLERYATDSILPQFASYFNENISRWGGCRIPSLLRYWIKWDRKNGLDALKRAMQFRERTGWFTTLLGQTLKDYYGQDAEELAVSYLKDPELDVVVDVIRLLSKKGSDSCIDLFLQRLSTLNPENKTSVGGFSEAGAYSEIIESLLGTFETKRWTLTKEQQKILERYLQDDFQRRIFNNRFG